MKSAYLEPGVHPVEMPRVARIGDDEVYTSCDKKKKYCGGFLGTISPVAINPLTQMLLNGLAASWHFNAGTTTFPADFGPYNLFAFGTLSIVAGKLLNAVEIQTNEALSGDNLESVFTFDDGLFTWHMWIKFSVLPSAGSEDILYKAANNGGYILRLASTGQLTFFTGNGASYDSVVWGSNLSINTWYQIVCGRDANNLYVQVNTESVLGVVASSPSAAYIPPSPIQNFNIPATPPGHTMNFLLDELISWSRFLSLAERTFLWNNGIGLAYPF